ncbi:MAG: hypothetical protein FIB04_13435 [Gammaproteobacteria bacterium]|nr:hypothetical protein [Gammaproteobacteria bacterium]
MQPSARLALCGVLLAFVAGCGGGSPEPQDDAEAKAHGRDTDKTVFDDMIQTQDKARAVEDVTMASKAATDAAIDRAEGDSKDEQR